RRLRPERRRGLVATGARPRVRTADQVGVRADRGRVRSARPDRAPRPRRSAPKPANSGHGYVRSRYVSVPTVGGETGRRFAIALAVIALAALVIRIVFIVVVAPTVPTLGDAGAYHLLAENLARGRGYIRPF